MEEIKLDEIFNTLWKKKIEIILIICVFVTMGIVYTFNFVTPKYTSSITMVLVSTNNDKNSIITTTDITLNSKLISTYRKLIKSKTVLKDVITNLGLSTDINDIKNNISVSAINNTELIEIKVENEDSKLAAQIANEIAKVFKGKIKEMYNINNVEIMSEAKIEKEPSNINHKKDIAIFACLGIAISIAYVVFSNMLDTTIKSSEMVEEEFELPVLASIPILRRTK